METPLVLRATLPVYQAKRGTSSPSPQRNPESTPRTSLRQLANAVSRIPAGPTDHKAIEVHRALRNLHLLMRSERLYEKDHPRRLDSLDSAYDCIRNATEMLGGLEIRVERGGLVAPRVSDAHLADARGEMQALAIDLQRAGIHAL
ncbi:MAG TPA: hypothetical protein VEM60_05540, partial [Candidatus Dormibacteraeota bacterium]|nr:hypothetical protein [Candidatus Dormibacteraeota bacterium]